MHPTIPIAENHIRISRALFDEAMSVTADKAYKKTIHRLAFALLILSLAAAAWLVYTGGSLVFLLGESVFLGALLVWLFVMLPGSKHRNRYKVMTRSGTVIPERTIRFYDTQLSVTDSTGQETIIPYAEAEQWQETKHLYILNCSQNRSVLLDKKGFVKGDFDAIKSLLPYN